MSEYQTISLSHGALRFTAKSLGTGPLVICLHGFPDNIQSFRKQMPALASAGYRAVAISLRGYEPSSLPENGDYSLASLAQDVIAFVDQLGEQKAHLIGHDWGAAVAYTVGSIAPERFTSLVTIALPHPGRFANQAFKYPRQLMLSWYMGFFQLRGIAEYCVQRKNYQLIKNLWRNWSPSWTLTASVMDGIIADLSKPGVTKAVLSYYRAALAPRTFSSAARAAAKFKVAVPTLAILGSNDGCIDSRFFKKLMIEEDFPAGLEIREVADAGHFPHQEQAEQVNGWIIAWINQWQNSTPQK
jgi:pimeloyl-ACP methyl ester carboxylesterase